MNNFRLAPVTISDTVERCLGQTTPGARLEKDSVKLCPIPGTAFDATIFIYRKNGRRVFVAELHRSDLPHVYKAVALTQNTISNATKIVGCVLSLAKRIREDSRFERKIIRLSS